jgi:hypothetical protein
MLWNRCLGYSGTLKEIAASRLGIALWTTDVDIWTENLLDIVRNYFPTWKDNVREEIRYILGEKPKTIEQMIVWMGSPEKMNQRQQGLQQSLTKIDSLAKKYFSGDRLDQFYARFFKLVLARSQAKDEEIHYTDIPLEIIAPYAIEDADYTDKIRDHMEKEIKAAGLERGAEIYNSQAKLGFEMESAGIAWNDTLAGYLSDVYIEKAINSLRSLLMVPKFQKLLKSPNSETGEKIADCPEDILTIQTTVDIDVLTSYFNPRSNHQDTREAFSRLITTGRLKFIVLIHEIFKEYEVNKEECATNFPILTPILEGILQCCTTEENKEQSTITAEDVMNRIAIIDNQVKHSDRLGSRILNHNGNSSDRLELDIFTQYAKWEIPSMEAAIIEDLYSAFTNILGMNIDDPDTWCDEFRWCSASEYIKRL